MDKVLGGTVIALEMECRGYDILEMNCAKYIDYVIGMGNTLGV
jgi:hypothetical protein